MSQFLISVPPPPLPIATVAFHSRGGAPLPRALGVYMTLTALKNLAAESFLLGDCTV
jgi:hypothetical protein